MWRKYCEAIVCEVLDNDAAIECDEVLLLMQQRIDLQVRGYWDYQQGEVAALPANHYYMTGYMGAKDGLTLEDSE